MSLHVELFNNIKPRIVFGFSLLTLGISTGPFMDRFLVVLSNAVAVITTTLTTLHIVVNFKDTITTNIILGSMLLNASVQIILKIVWTKEQRSQLNMLLDWVQSLHEENNDQLKDLIQSRLIKYGKIWLNIFKIGGVLYTLTAIDIHITNWLREEEGIYITIPLLPSDATYHWEITFSVQLFLICMVLFAIIRSDLSIIFIGFEIMAALEIVNEFITSSKETIQEDVNFFRILITRYCNVIPKIHSFNYVIYFISLIQFICSFLLFLLIFLYIRLNPEKFDGYAVAATILTQPFFLCVFGEFIRIKTDVLSTSLYMTNWYDLGFKDQKTFLLVLGMIQRPYGLKAAGMYDINLKLYIEITKVAFSVYAILYTLSKA